ncbi:MAG: hypothetical protein LBI26_00775 [Holosporales bacterium]|jgi:hypothetical protein|nr:hypothetical protein [Holosporales bacterium]
MLQKSLAGSIFSFLVIFISQNLSASSFDILPEQGSGFITIPIEVFSESPQLAPDYSETESKPTITPNKKFREAGRKIIRLNRIKSSYLPSIQTGYSSDQPATDADESSLSEGVLDMSDGMESALTSEKKPTFREIALMVQRQRELEKLKKALSRSTSPKEISSSIQTENQIQIDFSPPHSRAFDYLVEITPEKKIGNELLRINQKNKKFELLLELYMCGKLMDDEKTKPDLTREVASEKSYNKYVTALSTFIGAAKIATPLIVKRVVTSLSELIPNPVIGEIVSGITGTAITAIPLLIDYGLGKYKEKKQKDIRAKLMRFGDSGGKGGERGIILSVANKDILDDIIRDMLSVFDNISTYIRSRSEIFSIDGEIRSNLTSLENSITVLKKATEPDELFKFLLKIPKVSTGLAAGLTATFAAINPILHSFPTLDLDLSYIFLNASILLSGTYDNIINFDYKAQNSALALLVCEGYKEMWDFWMTVLQELDCRE